MTAEPWDPRYGPGGPPKIDKTRDSIKRMLATLLAFGKSPNNPTRGVAVLSYHTTEADRGHPWWVDFHGQMALIADLGYRVGSLARGGESLRQTETRSSLQPETKSFSGTSSSSRVIRILPIPIIIIIIIIIIITYYRKVKPIYIKK
jgi:hypothetical protein